MTTATKNAEGDGPSQSTSETVSKTWPDLVCRAKARYAVGKRGYHSFEHAQDVLDRVRIVHEQIGFMNYRAVTLAALYHDAVYVPGDGTNEIRSALAMLEDCSEESCEVLERAHKLILATAHHLDPASYTTDWDTMLLMDCDMQGFAADWVRYAHDNRQIALEFSHIDPAIYQSGRIRFLGALHQKGVFRSPCFQKKYERRALDNIRTALDALGVVEAP